MAFFNETKGKKKDDSNWQPLDKDISEMEKLLTKLLLNSGKDVTVVEDFIDFSSDNWSTDEDIDDYPEDDDDDDDNDDHNDDYDMANRSLSTFRDPVRGFPTILGELSTKLAGTLADKPTTLSKEEISKVKSSSGKDLVSLQRSQVPLKISDDSRSCNLCSWKSQNGSAESLLRHYKTAAHQSKLKERFLPEQTKPIAKGQRIQAIPSELFSTEKTFSKAQEGESKKQCKIQTGQQPQQPEQEPHQAKKKKNRSKQKNANEIQKKNQNPEKTETDLGNGSEKNIFNIKLHTLAKGMLCIQPLSSNNLSCKMCNKIIPEAPDFSSLMKNVSTHLQSKKHLKKLSEVEDSLKTALTQPKSSVPEKNSNPKKGEMAAEKNSNPKKGEMAAEKNSNPKKGEKAVEKKVQSPGQKSTPKCVDPGKRESDKEKPEKSVAVAAAPTPAPTPQLSKFLCLHCNFFTSDCTTFNSHLNSKSHVVAHKSEDGTLNDFWENCGMCKGCKGFLYGSLYDINKHHFKCLGKKN